MDAANLRVCSAQRGLLRCIAEADRRELWAEEGARDMAHLLGMRYGISHWKARRWVEAAHALEALPATSDAFERGRLGIDQLVELTRMATPETEHELVSWAASVPAGRIRHRAELEARATQAEVRSGERDRTLSWWPTEGSRAVELFARLPAAAGAVVTRALDRLAAELPSDEDDADCLDARRADALVAMCSARLAGDADQDRATIVVHARADAVANGAGSWIEGGGVVAPATLDRLLCHSRIQMVLEDGSGDVVRLGRISREPPAWMMRQLRYRDVGCTFPGCGARRFLHAHHIVWWERGGATDLDNLTLLCSFHHKLPHEFGWRVERGDDAVLRWYRPGGDRHLAGPDPPRQTELVPA